MDLEARLKNSSCQPDSLSANIEQFFAANQVSIPGVAPHDFYKAIALAVEQGR
jgi:hypothetical protein